MLIQRNVEQKARKYAQIFPVLGILGPRQVGKTTFVKQLMETISKPTLYLDLEKTSDIEKLRHPEIYLSEYQDSCVIIDEIQIKPDLFSILRSLVDTHKVPLRFIILGSASPAIIRHSSETLAGRIGYIQLYPFDCMELKHDFQLEKHLLHGGFPLSYLSESSENSRIWLSNFIKTYIERDLPQLGLSANPLLTRRLWEMLAWQSGNLVNYSSLGKSLSLSNHTVNSYMDFLEGAFMIKRLPPYHFNIKKRLVKTPKIYLSDTGIMLALLRISDFEQIMGSPFLGAAWETYILNQILANLPDNMELFFYRTHAGAEVDLVFAKGLQPVASVEIKFSYKAKITKGFQQSISDLKTPKNFIITSQNEDFPADENIRVCSIRTFVEKYINYL